MASLTPPPGARVSYRRQYRRCGKPGCSVCGPDGQGHGPYWYAYWSEDGRMRSSYVGKEPPPGVEERPAARPGRKSSRASPTVAANGAPSQSLDAAPMPRSSDVAPMQTPAAARPPNRPTATPLTVVAPLRVRALGGFTVWRGAEPIPDTRWRRRKVTALFQCLLGMPGYRMHREQVIDLLWPDADPAEGAHSLRSTIYLLRQTLEAPATPDDARAAFIRSEDEWIVLDPASGGAPDPDWLDATAFERAAFAALAGRNMAACRAAGALYAGPYLPGEVFADWAVVRREALQGQYRSLLLHLADLCGSSGELDEAETLLRQVMLIDPCHEEAAQSLITLLAGAGRRGEARQVYQALAAALVADLGVDPGPATQALHARLLARETAPRPADLAPVAQIPRQPTNLPAPLSSFVGREQERATLRDLLTHTPTCRLLTLTGPGGSGKTRMALAVAAEMLTHFPDGVWLVELAATPATSSADSDVPARIVGLVLGVPEAHDRAGSAALAEFLRPRRLLLVLDNCEHMLAACARLAGTLLAACPHLCILATSREALGLTGEVAWLVPPLTMPLEGVAPTPAALARSDAVTLFVERARRSRPGFALTAANAAAVAAICRRLDGMPLAIELAAARLSLLSVDAVVNRLNDRFRLLTGGDRAVLPRQQTLRATMDWSYALLDTPERALLQRLSVFAGGCTLEAAEAVCGVEDVLDLLFRLVARSLVVAHDEGGETRCRLLETVREYAAEQLPPGEVAPLRARHAAWYGQLAAQAEAAWEGPEQPRWRARLGYERENLHLALTWLRAAGRGEDLLRMATALRPFWEMDGAPHEGRRRLEEALALASTASAALRARALTGAGRLAELQGEYAGAAALYEESLALWRPLGDRRGMANALIGLGVVVAARGRMAEAGALFAQSLALDKELGYRRGMIISLNNLGGVAYYLGDHARARDLFAESLAQSRAAGDKRSLARALNNLAELTREDSAHARAAALYQECLALYGELGDRQGIAMGLEGLAGALGALGLPARAAQLHGVAEALRAAIGVPLPPQERAAYARDRAALVAALGEMDFAEALAAGQSMSMEQGIAIATSIRVSSTA